MARRLFAVFAAAAAACGGTPRGADRDVDLVRRLSAADIRPAHQRDAWQVVEAMVHDRWTPALSATVPARATFSLRVPRRAAFSTALKLGADASRPGAGGVVFRLGISDGRVYEPLFEHEVLAADPPEWVPVLIDLTRYAGWQWSLFYRPSSIDWQLVLNAYPSTPADAGLQGLWAAPRIERREMATASSRQ